MRCVAEPLPGCHQEPCTYLRVPWCVTRDHVHVPVSALGAMFMSGVLLLGAKLIPLLALSNRMGMLRDAFAASLALAPLSPRLRLFGSRGRGS